MNETRTPNFFDEAIAAFGHEGAYELGQTILSSVEAAQKRLPLLRPIKGMRLLIMETGNYVSAFADTNEDSVDLIFSPSAVSDLGLLNSEVEPSIEHEVAHLAHLQQYPEFWADSEKGIFLFAVAVREGIAKYAEESLYDSYTATNFITDYPDEEAAQIMDTIARILYETRDTEREDHYPFLRGELDFPATGYEVGHFVVAAMVHDYGLSLEQLMKTPVLEFKEFVETEL